MQMNNLKNRQRSKANDARNEQVDKEALSRVICDRVIANPVYRQAETVMWYSHCRSEVRTRAALLRELTTAKRIVVPYCTKDRHGHNKLGLWWLEQGSELVPGMWGILEPPKQRWQETDKAIAAEQLDCVVVPGVAFDRNGGRLGNGGGYYDRLLSGVRVDTLLIGVCFESQLVKQVVSEEHDVTMDRVITEKADYAGKGRRLLS